MSKSSISGKYTEGGRKSECLFRETEKTFLKVNHKISMGRRKSE